MMVNMGKLPPGWPYKLDRLTLTLMIVVGSLLGVDGLYQAVTANIAIATGTLITAGLFGIFPLLRRSWMHIGYRRGRGDLLTSFLTAREHQVTPWEWYFAEMEKDLLYLGLNLPEKVREQRAAAVREAAIAELDAATEWTRAAKPPRRS